MDSGEAVSDGTGAAAGGNGAAPDRGMWGSRLGFILAAAGSAVGLGNLWKFPYLTYSFGGGDPEKGSAGGFVFVYLLAVIFVGLPVMLAEVLIGRRGRLNPVGSFRVLRPGTRWKLVGFLGLLTGFLILSYYAVVAGWTLEYVLRSIMWDFGERDPAASFKEFTESPLKQVGYFLAFMAVTMLVVVGGVAKGIERWNRILMPLLLLMLLILAVRVLTLPGGEKAVRFLLWPDFASLNTDMVLEALGQAFFSMSLGMGALLTYGSYLPKKANLGSACVAIAALDVLVALVASIVIFGAIFSFGIVMKDGGIGNLFTAIPMIFLKMPGGRWMCLMFYTLVCFAALTSSVSLQEVVSSYLIDERRMARKKAVLVAGLAISALGVFCALSFNLLANVTLFDKTIFLLLDYFCANLALPTGGIMIAIFVGWVLTGEEKREELSELHPAVFATWNFLVRYVAPIAILLVLGAKLMGKISG